MKRLFLIFFLGLMFTCIMAEEVLINHLEGLTLCNYAIKDGKPNLINKKVIKSCAESAAEFEVSIIDGKTIFLFEKEDRNGPNVFSLYNVSSGSLQELFAIQYGKTKIIAATCSSHNIFTIEVNTEEKEINLVKRNFDSEIISSIAITLDDKNAYAIKQIFIDASGKYLVVFIPYYKKFIVFSTIDGHQCFSKEGRPLSISLNKEKIYYSLGDKIFEIRFNDEEQKPLEINSAAGKKEEITYFEELSEGYSIVCYETKKKQGFLSILLFDDIYKLETKVYLCVRTENTLKKTFLIEKLKNSQYSFYSGGNGWFCMYDYKKELKN